MFRNPNQLLLVWVEQNHLTIMPQFKLLEKEFISVAELMQLFSISRATAQRLLKSGEIQSQKLGGKVIIPTGPIKQKFSLDK